jgi:hypothetical protein
MLPIRKAQMDDGDAMVRRSLRTLVGYLSRRTFASQYVINIGYGDDKKVFPRLPRFNVDEIARFADPRTLDGNRLRLQFLNGDTIET